MRQRSPSGVTLTMRTSLVMTGPLPCIWDGIVSLLRCRCFTTSSSGSSDCIQNVFLITQFSKRRCPTDLVKRLRLLDIAPGVPLLVFESDPTPEDETALREYGPHPYAIVLGVTENARGRGLGGSGMANTLDVILEQAPVDGKRPGKQAMWQLRDTILEVSKEVTELEYGVPLLPVGGRHLRYQSGSPIGARYQEPLILTCTLRFTCSWAGNF